MTALLIVTFRFFESAFIGEIVVVFLAILAAKWIVESRFYFIAREAIGLFIDKDSPRTHATTYFMVVPFGHERSRTGRLLLVRIDIRS